MPHTLPNTQVADWVWGEFLPLHPNDRKCTLKIKYLRVLGVGGVEGAVRKIFCLLCARAYAREGKETRERYQVCLVESASWKLESTSLKTAAIETFKKKERPKNFGALLINEISERIYFTTNFLPF